MLEGAGLPLTMHQKGGIMDEVKPTVKSSKKTNNEIVRSLITMLQAFTEQQDPGAEYTITIDEDNLVSRVSLLIRTFQRQQDRIGDMVDGMQKIAKGE
jgi:hypothetical protein